jgi:hypothetical protein
MKRTYALSLVALAAAVLLAGLVYGVLQVAHLSEPAATTIYGPTVRRLWATTIVALAFGGVIVGAVALARPSGGFGAVPWGFAITMAGLIASINGGLVLAVAKGGPGSGNGVVGGAAALVLGLAAMAMGGLRLARSRASGRR